MTKIITLSDSDEIVEWVTKFLASSPSNLIRIEGVCGSGKTTIAQKLQSNGVCLHINADDFVVRPAVATPYPGGMKQSELDAAIADAINTGKVVILDAVCLEEVAPVQRW
jgi:adenylate kinase family enzyme